MNTEKYEKDVVLIATAKGVIDMKLFKLPLKTISYPTGFVDTAVRVGPADVVKLFPFPLLSFHCVIGADPVIVDASAPSYHIYKLPKLRGFKVTVGAGNV
jgi:hypothetical protein